MKLPRKKLKASVPSFAMGDIAFLLLIFFVILARAQDDSHIQWQPARLDKVEMAPTARASVAIDTGSKTYLDGKEISPRSSPQNSPPYSATPPPDSVTSF